MRSPISRGSIFIRRMTLRLRDDFKRIVQRARSPTTGGRRLSRDFRLKRARPTGASTTVRPLRWTKLREAGRGDAAFVAQQQTVATSDDAARALCLGLSCSRIAAAGMSHAIDGRLRAS